MFIFVVILFTTGLIIEVAEELVGEDEAIPSYLYLIMSFLTAAHVFSGIFFTALSVFHIIKNWSALKKYLKAKNDKINKERSLALAWIAIIAVLGFIVALIKES
jgi:hypothetical protein